MGNKGYEDSRRDASDRALGMFTNISRRDVVVGGAAAGVVASGAPSFSQAAVSAGEQSASLYPPAKTGMRGSHPGSFEQAHLLRDGSLELGAARSTGETYDCVIVGGGLSGLAAAHFFLKRAGADARVLILENHDDFGGHAKRNEFTVDGRKVVLNGGTLNIESPQRYNRWARQILDDIGIDISRFEKANADTSGLYKSYGLTGGFFLDKESWGNDKLVVSGKGGYGFSEDLIASIPFSDKARQDAVRLFSAKQPDYLAGMSLAEKKQYLATTSYRDYLIGKVGVDEQVVWFLQSMGWGSFCVGADATPAFFAWMDGYPGFSSLHLGEAPKDLLADLPGGQHGRQQIDYKAIHFPDGNATLARLLVNGLIPDAVEGDSQEDMGLALVDYGKLDRKNQPARIRLSSIVVNVRHDGDPERASEAVVSYIKNQKLQSVRAKSVILACWHAVIPHIAPELPQEQGEALAYAIKAPLVYTNVALRNWRAFEKLGIARIESPSMFHQSVSLAESVDLGDLRHSRSPDQPVAVQLIKYANEPGLPKRDQHRIGRAKLLATSFETFERETRSQLARILSAGGFDPARDIAGITVNRWPHGYAYTYNSLQDPLEWVFTSSSGRPCVKARKPYGLIAIANSDAAASPHTDAAFGEAHRAVNEVLERLTYPFLDRT